MRAIFRLTERSFSDPGRPSPGSFPLRQDTLTLSADGRRLTGGNQYGMPVSASRVTGESGITGLWTWGASGTALIDANGTVKVGPFAGAWLLADPQQRQYRITWPKAVDDMTLSDDLNRIHGSNQYGFSISGARLPSCR